MLKNKNIAAELTLIIRRDLFIKNNLELLCDFEKDLNYLKKINKNKSNCIIIIFDIESGLIISRPSFEYRMFKLTKKQIKSNIYCLTLEMSLDGNFLKKVSDLISFQEKDSLKNIDLANTYNAFFNDLLEKYNELSAKHQGNSKYSNITLKEFYNLESNF